MNLLVTSFLPLVAGVAPSIEDVHIIVGKMLGVAIVALLVLALGEIYWPSKKK